MAQPDPSRCPLCGEVNRCAMEVERETGQPQPPCWCMQTDVNFGPALLDRLPADTRGLACICARCATAATATASLQD
ncbi:MAG: hypothetical protein EOP82_27325 [Variovorax sp.]|nr:MAG: hypothetical protein EOP82_27325 [Variovorax sp.]